MTAFCGLGQWRGAAEVYDGEGRFLGGGVDERHARRELEDGRIRIDLSFVGPFRFAGHYVIRDRGTHRVYEGPTNHGLAEAVAANLVDAESFWPAVGLSQRFFLMVLPGGDRQLSLSLLGRGDRLIYAVVGENERATACSADGSAEAPGWRALASCDLAADPTAGQGVAPLHRPGRWAGTLALHDGTLARTGEAAYEEIVTPAARGGIEVALRGGAFGDDPTGMSLRTDGRAAWSEAGPVVGSYALFGGRALVGTFHRVGAELSVHRREVVSQDGTQKAVVQVVRRGGHRLGVQHGVLAFEARG